MVNFSKIVGIIIGHALADAAGAFFEGRMNIKKEEIDHFFNTFEYRVNHFKRETNWDWTDDTDQLILLMEMLTETKGEINVNIFAKKLFDWVNHGFPELGDKKGEGCGGHTFSVITTPDFINIPIECSRAKYNQSGSAANGAIMRTSILACTDEKYEQIMKDTETICKVTHYSPLCIISCKVQVTLLLGILRDWNDDYTLSLVEEIVKEDVKAWNHYILSNDLDGLELNTTHMGYALKTMGVGIYAFKNRNKGYLSVLKEIFYSGGDVDTNGAVAGAILGAHVDGKNIPKEWISKLPNLNWLKPKIQSFINVLKN